MQNRENQARREEATESVNDRQTEDDITNMDREGAASETGGGDFSLHNLQNLREKIEEFRQKEESVEEKVYRKRAFKS